MMTRTRQIAKMPEPVTNERAPKNPQRGPREEVLSDAMHGDHTHFELVTVTNRRLG